MPAALKITLTTEENQTLQELEVAQTVPRRTKQRATALRLSSKGLKLKEIASYLGWAESTVRQTIHRLFETGKPTVIIHDNASIHRSKLVKKQHQV